LPHSLGSAGDGELGASIGAITVFFITVLPISRGGRPFLIGVDTMEAARTSLVPGLSVRCCPPEMPIADMRRRATLEARGQGPLAA
jgi:hypothetical protein